MSSPAFIKLVEKVFYHLKNNDGRLLYQELVQLYGQGNKSRRVDLNVILKTYPQLFELDEENYVSLKTDLQICKDYLTTEGCSSPKCNSFHICKFYICKTCTFKDSDCHFGHELNSYNLNILQNNNLGFLKKDDIFYLLKCNDPTFIPLPCKFYNNNNCQKANKCPFLHICQYYLKNQCQFNEKCKRCHNVLDNQPKAILIKYGIDIERSRKDILTYLRKSLLKLESALPDKVNDSLHQPYQLTADSELCLFYMQGGCRYGRSCRFIHVKAPYAWFYFSTSVNAWFLFQKQDILEFSYCNPAKYECFTQHCVENDSEQPQQYVVNINFLDWFLRGPEEIQVTKVYRLSIPSFGISKDKMAAHWGWYWQIDDVTWKEYGEEHCGHTANLTSHHIEKLYCNFNKTGKLEFTTNLFAYYICFDTMQQVNVTTNKMRQVRRRPKHITQDDLEYKSSEKSQSVPFLDGMSSLTVNDESEDDSD